MLILDGIRYHLHRYKNELELEEFAIEHYKDIFGENTLYFPIKRSIKTKAGLRTVPDGYLVDFAQRSFYLIEVELASHPEYDHISKQIGKFIGALQNYTSRQKIASVMTDYVRTDITRERLVKDSIGTSDIYQYFLENILEKVSDQSHETIIVIDEETREIREACNVLRPKPRIIEFRTYAREKVGVNVHIHHFEPLQTVREDRKKAQRRKGKLKALPQEDYRFPILDALYDQGGQTDTKTALNLVFVLVKDKLSKDDLEPPSSGREPRWRNRARWERQKMVKNGLVRDDLPTGVWGLTSRGFKLYESLRERKRREGRDS